jgi:hypothetical protein
MEFEQIHRVLGQSSPPLDAADHEAIETLRDLVVELDRNVASATGFDLGRNLYARAVVHSRLIRGSATAEEAVAEAELATADVARAITIFRDLALRGGVQAKAMLGGCVQRAATIFEWRPDKSLAGARAVEADLIEYTDLATDEDAFVACARFAVALATMCDESPQEAKEWSLACQRWTERAYEIQRALSTAGTPSSAGQLAELFGISAIAALRAWDRSVDPQRFLALVNRRVAQLDEVLPEVTGQMGEEAAATARPRIGQAIVGACREVLFTAPGSDGDDRAGTVICRYFIHQLSPALWSRDVTAAAVLAGLDTDVDPLEESLQSHLDRLETMIVRGVLRGIGPDLRDVAQALTDDRVTETLFTLAVIGPLPGVGHLAAAAALAADGESPTKHERDARDLLDSIRSVEIGSERVEFEDVSVAFLLAMQAAAGGWPDSSALEVEIGRLLERACIPLMRVDPSRGNTFSSLLFRSLAAAARRWPSAQSRQALEWLVRTEAMLASLEIAAPYLELARAEIAFGLADGNYDFHPIAQRAASAFAHRYEADPGLLDHEAFGPDPLLDALRILALSARVGTQFGLPEADMEEGEWAKARMLEVSRDPRVEAGARERAAAFLAELAGEEGMGAAEFEEVLALDWNDEMLRTGGVRFLVGLVQADEGVAAGTDPELLRRARRAAIEQIRNLGVIGAREAAYLPLLTEKEARVRMQMGGAEALELGRVAAAVLDAGQADAAAVAFDVVLNLNDIADDPEVELGVRDLDETVAERFLPAALEGPLGHRIVPRFLIELARHALNLGSLRAEEVHQRQRAALAGHLLAVARDDTDGAAMSAYLSAELARSIHGFTVAERWMAVYDFWRARGGLGHPVFEQYREHIEWDRERLREALSGASSEPVVPEVEADIAVEDTEEETIGGRLALLAIELGKEPLRSIDADDEASLNEVASVEFPAVLLLHHWNLALAVCARASREHPRRDLFAAVTAAVGEELLARKLPATVSQTASLPVLEMLVTAAIAVEDMELADRALGRLAAAYSALFLSTGLSSEFLSLRPTTGNLSKAAIRVFEQGYLRMALEIAETGRMKLLSSLASGGPRGVAEAPPPVSDPAELPESMTFIVDRLAAVIREPDAEAIEALVGSEFDREQLLFAVRVLALPWVRLASTLEERSTGIQISDEVWGKVLTEPSVDWLAGALEEDQVLIYPFVADFIGAAVMTRGDFFSFLQSADEYPEVGRELAELTLGVELKKGILARLGERGEADREWDVRLVAWDGESEAAVQRIGTGFWLGSLMMQEPPLVPVTMPTARLLKMDQRAIVSPPRTVSFLGDPYLGYPEHGLVGPWIDGIGWVNSFGSALRSYMGGAATKEAALTALCESDLVVFSGHTFGELGDDGFGLGLSDGVLTSSDLLEVHGEVKASTAILSCCSPASVSDRVEAEVVSIVTTLIGLGVRQVLAPLVPIDDPAAAIFGARTASAVAAGHDLRGSLVQVGRDFLGPTRPPVSTALPPEWVDLCPHAAVMASYVDVSQQALIALLSEFSVFGGGG